MHKTIQFRLFSVLALLFLLGSSVPAQVTCDPAFPTATDNVTIYFDASQGNTTLIGFAGPVFMHTGVITNLSAGPTDWKHVPTTWGINDPVGAMTNVGPNLWKKTIAINTFYGVPGGETVQKLAFVFRNQDGSKVGRAADQSDIFYTVYPASSPLQTVILQPSAPSLLVNNGNTIPVKTAASKTSTLVLKDNGTQIATANGKNLDATITANVTGLHTVELVATVGTETSTSSFVYLVATPAVTQDPPAGTKLGINYTSTTSVRLALYAPNKQAVYVIGEFNNWLPNPDYQMRRSVDGKTWWLDVPGLTAGQQYRFQYLVDGILRIADPLSTLVLDPSNDPYIPAVTYPNVPAYPTGKTTGIVSVLQTAQPVFDWQATNYQRPKKTDLVIYELLLRDFVARHDYETLLDTLDYLDRLGVNAIELMPINEFDGNTSWGYNPSFHKALDKYYGTATALKTLIDECHKRNIAIILDVVFNHTTNDSPLARLYWDGANNRPAADNPWLNPIPKHEFNVFNDFNHESAATKEYVKNCLNYWQTEFKIDGFRFDLSKGFTQKNTLGSVSNWGVYDATRVAIWKDYANAMWATDPATFVILEHFADNPEEKELAEYGMMPWGNMRFNYKEVANGYNTTTSLSGISYKDRNWTVPHLVGYMESHDEDRLGFECRTYGNSSQANYNIKFLPIAMLRAELMQNLFYTVPGPKMLWQFGEVGYDFSIRRCEDGTLSDNCRLSPKPIRWDYPTDPYRRRLYDVMAALIHLRTHYDVFETTDFQLSISTGAARTIRLNSAAMNVHVLTNTGITPQLVTANFQHPGTWYEYYTGATLNVTNLTMSMNFQPGEYRLYIDQFVPLPPGLNTTPVREVAGLLGDFEVYPNPAGDVLYVDFNLNDGGDVALEIRNTTGQLVNTQIFSALPSGPQHFELNTATLYPGVYFVCIRDENGALLSKKLMKF